MKPYLSICSIYRDHAAYLREWIEFHLLVGVERFFLYDNESSDDHELVLAPYVAKGIVVVHPWPSPATSPRGAPWGLVPAFNDCLERHRQDSRWIAFLDIDEFVFSPTGRPLPEVLRGFEEWPGVCMSRVDFGTSGHRTTPAGLVIESYTRRRSYPEGSWELVKSVVDPARTAECFNAHRFLYREGVAVDENGVPFQGERVNRGEVLLRLLRVNHYVTKSEEELRRKHEQWDAAGHDRPVFDETMLESLCVEQDETIGMYLPALRRALTPELEGKPGRL